MPRIVLSPSERQTLEQYARRPTAAQALALRSRIVLRCATGDVAVPPDLDIHLILADYATHRRASIQRWLVRHPRYQLHFPPPARLG